MIDNDAEQICDAFDMEPENLSGSAMIALSIAGKDLPWKESHWKVFHSMNMWLQNYSLTRNGGLNLIDL